MNLLRRRSGIPMILSVVITMSLCATLPAQDEKPKVGVKKDGEGKKKNAERDQLNGVRGTIKTIDAKKGTLVLVQRRDNGTTLHELNLAGKDIPVTGLIKKLSQLRPGLQVFAKLNKAKDVVAIRTSRGRPTNRIERVFRTYDNDFDQKVTFKEWLRLREGKIDDARRKRERSRFDAVDTDNNGTLSFEEFARWRNGGRRSKDG